MQNLKLDPIQAIESSMLYIVLCLIVIFFTILYTAYFTFAKYIGEIKDKIQQLEARNVSLVNISYDVLDDLNKSEKIIAGNTLFYYIHFLLF